MRKSIFIIVCIVLSCASEGFVSTSKEDSNDYRKEAWKVFGQAAGLGGYVDKLIADPNKLSEDSLITVRTIDYDSKPIPYSRITFVDHDEKTTRNFYEFATDKNGYAYCDVIGGTFSIMAQIFSYEPQKKAWRYQSRKFEKLYDVNDKPEIIIKWPKFPEGTGKVLGNIKDQYGRPLEKFELSLTHRDGQAQGWEEYYSIHTEQNFDNSEGYFEISDLAPLTYSYMIYPNDANNTANYAWDFDMGTVTIHDEPNEVVQLNIEIEAKELRYGQAFYHDGSPVYPGSFQLWFKIYSPEERLQYHVFGEGHRNKIEPNGLFCIPLSQQEKKDFIKETQGYVIIEDEESKELDQVHIDKLSETPNNVPKIFFPRKSPRLSLVSSNLPDMNNIKIDFNTEQVKGRKVIICFFDIEQRPSRNCILELKKKSQELKEKSIDVLAIHTSKVEHEYFDKWLKENNIPFPIGIIENNKEQTRFNWGVKALPWLILADKNHIVTNEGFSINELDENVNMSNSSNNPVYLK